MDNFTKSKLIDLFWEGIADTPWDVWCDTSSGDKERIVPDAIVELGVDVDIDEAYDLFWEWADGLDEDSFRPVESTKIAESVDDPYGYGPYKNFSDPDLKVGDYVLTTRPFSKGGRTYPAKITSVSPKWIDYEISGFGFTDRGTKARPGSASDQALRKAAAYLKK